MMSNTEEDGFTSQQANSTTTTYGVSHEDRQVILLDDLRAEIKRLTDAVERQNELIDNGQETEQ